MYRRCASPYPHDSFPAENSARHVRQNPLPIASIYIIDHFSFRQDNRTQNPRGVLPEQRSAGIYDWFMAAHPPFPCGCSTPPVLRLMLVRVVVEISEYQYFKTFLTCLYYIPIVDSAHNSRCSHECCLLHFRFLGSPSMRRQYGIMRCGTAGNGWALRTSGIACQQKAPLLFGRNGARDYSSSSSSSSTSLTGGLSPSMTMPCFCA